MEQVYKCKKCKQWFVDKKGTTQMIKNTDLPVELSKEEITCSECKRVWQIEMEQS